MTIDKLTTIDQIEQFLIETQVCIYEVACNKSERYRWIQRTLIQFRYITLSKPEKGVVVRTPPCLKRCRRAFHNEEAPPPLLMCRIRHE